MNKWNKKKKKYIQLKYMFIINLIMIENYRNVDFIHNLK